jgi:hypothetical protein
MRIKRSFQFLCAGLAIGVVATALWLYREKHPIAGESPLVTLVLGVAGMTSTAVSAGCLFIWVALVISTICRRALGKKNDSGDRSR